MRRFFMMSLLLALLISCTGSPERGARGSFDRAASLATTNDLAGAFAALQESMRAGYPTPSDVLTADSFGPLLDDAHWRPQVYELLKASARERTISMTPADEPGEPMILTVHIVGAENEPPEAVVPPIRRAGVVVGLVQVNAAGYYQPWTKDEDWNPRHFGFAMTDDTGTVVVHTRYPGYYATEYDAPEEPRHVHYNVTNRGALLRASEFYFQGDPRLDGPNGDAAKVARVPIASIVRDEDGVWRGEVTIPVRGLR